MLPTPLIFISIKLYWGGSNCETTFTKVIYVSPVVSYTLSEQCTICTFGRARFNIYNIISASFINLNHHGRFLASKITTVAATTAAITAFYPAKSTAQQDFTKRTFLLSVMLCHFYDSSLVYICTCML